MTEGNEAADRLVAEHPDAHKYFSLRSLALFRSALAIWDVFEDDGCWIMLEGTGPDRELHWFCPHGAKLPALRRILHHVFFDLGVESVGGEQPKGHPYRREARALARALGAEAWEEGYVLTSARFAAYNRDKRGFLGDI